MGEIVSLAAVRARRSLIQQLGVLADRAETPCPTQFGWVRVPTAPGMPVVWCHPEYSASVHQVGPSASGVRYRDAETVYEGLTVEELILALEFGSLSPMD